MGYHGAPGCDLLPQQLAPYLIKLGQVSNIGAGSTGLQLRLTDMLVGISGDYRRASVLTLMKAFNGSSANPF